MHARHGQAMIEFAIGMFIFALILSALFAFAAIIPESTRAQNMVRRLAGRDAESGGGSPDGALPVRTSDALPAALRSVPAVELVRRQIDFTVDIGAFAAENLLGDETAREVRVSEEAYMPALGIPRFDAGTIAEGEGLL